MVAVDVFVGDDALAVVVVVVVAKHNCFVSAVKDAYSRTVWTRTL